MATSSATQGTPTIRTVLAPHVTEFEQAAEVTDDPAEADVYVVLATMGRGQTPPKEASARVLQRAREGDDGR